MSVALFPCPNCANPEGVSADFGQASLCTVCAVSWWEETEKIFSASSYHGIDKPGATRRIAGEKQVTFVSSASVRYFRNKVLMPPALHTGGLVLTAANLTGQSAIALSSPQADPEITTAPNPALTLALNETTDPNTFVVDIRGMLNRNVDICIGTGPDPDDRTQIVADKLTHYTQARGLRTEINMPFAALPTWTVVNYTQDTLKMSGIQIQLANWLRHPNKEPAHALNTLQTLRHLVKIVSYTHC